MTVPVITLLHGTFARDDATWTLKDSPFRCAIAAADGFGTPVFKLFKWSGKNTFRARHDEVARLEAHVVKVEQDHQKAPHFLIAHSHGGSIVAYWIKHAKTNNHKRIAGAAFLSTPFVAVRPINDEQSMANPVAGWIVAWLGLLLGGGAAMAFACWLGHWSFGGMDEERTTVVLTSWAALVGALAGLFWYVRNRKMIKAYASKGGTDLLDEIANAHSTCDLPGHNYLFLKGTGDEVLSALGTAQFVGLITKHIRAATTRLAKRWVEWHPIPTIVALLSMAVLITWAFELPTELPRLWNESPSIVRFFFGLSPLLFAHPLSWLFLAVAGSLMLAIFAAGAVWLVGLIVMRLPLRAFGDISAVAAAQLEVGVEPLPYGPRTLHHVRWARTQTGLHHSVGYSAEVAINLVIPWMQKRLVEFRST